MVLCTNCISPYTSVPMMSYNQPKEIEDGLCHTCKKLEEELEIVW
ncbi:hypothetical protein [Bacillus phage CP-51]|uniref:Uncharacterized protein n=1 Tax=Bacillus phage CP-51 TaxID=1391188 RepID=A0A068EMG1_9CAUD|nr:hypothetical protein OZ73_gp128 [Bacillus phage CP-51]AID50563.1 hypothetical protein [Bacillus phage CP-51]